MIYSRFISIIDSIIFFVRNIIAAKKIANIKVEEDGVLLFRGYCSSDEKEIADIYKKLNSGSIFSRLQRALYRRIGQRFMLVAEERDQFGYVKVVGINMYYLNKRDVFENTIHEGFIGILPRAGGKGVATKMRKIAIKNFKSAGFLGISTRISLNNTASLMSAKKIGFQVVEEYKDKTTGEHRFYMVYSF